MITFMPFFRNYPPSCLSFFLKDMQISYGKSIFPFPLIGILFGHFENYDDGTTNYRYSRQGYTNFNFLINGGEMLCLYLAILATIPVMYLIRICCHKNTDVYWYESRWRWEMMVKGFILMYMPILITALMDVSNEQYDKTIDIVSYVCAWIAIAYCIIGFITIFALTTWFMFLP